MSIWTSEDFKEFPSRYEKTGEEMSGGASFHVARTFAHDFLLLELEHGVDQCGVLLSLSEARDLAAALEMAAFEVECSLERDGQVAVPVGNVRTVAGTVRLTKEAARDIGAWRDALRLP